MTSLPNKSTLATLGLDKQTGWLWLNVALVILLAVTILSLPSDETHIVVGILLMIGCGIHLILNRRWIQAVILGVPQNVTSALRCQRRLFWGMFLSGFLCGLSGLAMMPFALAPHAFLPLHCCGTPIHVLSGLAFFGFNIYHLVLHRNWFTTRLGRVSAAARR